LAARLGLRVPKREIIDVREELIANTEDLVIQLGRGAHPVGLTSNSDRDTPAIQPRQWSSISFQTNSFASCRISLLSAACWF
jgi:hypothetical protein